MNALVFSVLFFQINKKAKESCREQYNVHSLDNLRLVCSNLYASTIMMIRRKPQARKKRRRHAGNYQLFLFYLQEMRQILNLPPYFLLSKFFQYKKCPLETQLLAQFFLTFLDTYLAPVVLLLTLLWTLLASLNLKQVFARFVFPHKAPVKKKEEEARSPLHWII